MAATKKTPRFSRFTTWGACSRCGTRFAYESLRRERLTGLLLCTPQSWPNPRERGCWDPWHPSLSFQAKADQSINPPREPLPLRTGLDTIFSAGAGQIVAGPDGQRWNVVARTNYQTLVTPATTYIKAFAGGNMADGPRFSASPRTVDRSAIDPTNFQAAGYDGVFVPSQSARVNLPPVPPDMPAELAADYPPLNLPSIITAKRV